MCILHPAKENHGRSPCSIQLQQASAPRCARQLWKQGHRAWYKPSRARLSSNFRRRASGCWQCVHAPACPHLIHEGLQQGSEGWAQLADRPEVLHCKDSERSHETTRKGRGNRRQLFFPARSANDQGRRPSLLQPDSAGSTQRKRQGRTDLPGCDNTRPGKIS